MDVDDLADLVSRCIEGKDDARAQFYYTFVGLVRRAVLHTLRRGDLDASELGDADDLCNDIFERLFADDCSALKSVKNPTSLNAWLTTVSRNHVISAYRKRLSVERMQAFLVRESSFQYTESPSESIMREEELGQVRRLLDELAPTDRLVLELYYLHDLKYHEISDMLGININTFSARLRRAKEKLRDIATRVDHD